MLISLRVDIVERRRVMFSAPFLLSLFFQEYNFDKFCAALFELTSKRRKLTDGLFERYFQAL